MILTKTPLRISLVGGGTDLPSFYQKYGGAVVSFTIDKYVYIAVNKPMEWKVRLSYSETENVKTASELKHDLARACLQKVGIENNIEIVSIADIPGKGTGLGSSSAFTVGLLNALTQFCIKHRYKGCKHYDMFEVADEACDVEIRMCEKPIGKQDQYAVAYGGLNHFVFQEDGHVQVKRIPLSDDMTESDEMMEELNSRFLLFYTGITRRSKDILITQNSKIESNRAVVEIMKEMKDIAIDLYERLLLGDLDAVGEALHENWMRKRILTTEISNDTIEKYYEIARTYGAVGGKVLGAGGGGFMLFYVPKERQLKFLKKMPLKFVPFKITKKGTQLVYSEGFDGK